MDAIPSGILNLEVSHLTSGKWMLTTEFGEAEILHDCQGGACLTHYRYGLKAALQLKVIQPEDTIMAVQGWKGGLGHVSGSALLALCHAADVLVITDQHSSNLVVSFSVPSGNL